MGMEAFANKSTPGHFAQKITTPKKVLKKKCYATMGMSEFPTVISTSRMFEISQLMFYKEQYSAFVI